MVDYVRLTCFPQLDKDIAMDVIEGRGVKALVYNPNKYERVSIFPHRLSTRAVADSTL